MTLRKIIEKTSYSAKFIFEVSSLSSISEPLLSRFLLLRVSIPSKDDIITCLKNYSERKNIKISDENINYIIDNSCKISNTYNLKKIFEYAAV
jgi:DNA polymerase III delta prime subunit